MPKIPAIKVAGMNSVATTYQRADLHVDAVAQRRQIDVEQTVEQVAHVLQRFEHRAPCGQHVAQVELRFRPEEPGIAATQRVQRPAQRPQRAAQADDFALQHVDALQRRGLRACREFPESALAQSARSR